MPNRIGKQLGNYRLRDLLGEGGFAQVYLGEHKLLGTHAAIKVLLATLEEQYQTNFLTEARTIARLKHVHIIRLLDFGLASKTPFMVMDYAPHGTLRKQCPKGTQLPLLKVVNYVEQISGALQYAHEQEIIHCDIKPENLLMGEENNILVSDFGIAAIVHSTKSLETKAVVGSYRYMAPEQFKGKPQPASDQYALGVVVYEWLTGVLPFLSPFA